MGEKGEDGAQGIAGPKGNCGKVGPMGPRGLRGMAGANRCKGKQGSAFQINWKQCVWIRNDKKDIGLIQVDSD